MDQGIDILSYVKALSRRVWTILAVFVLGSLLAVAVALVLPPVYESTAKILVETQQIPEELAQTTVRQSVAERLELIEQRLMTRDNLLGIINRVGLFADRDDLTPSDKVDLVRQATWFNSISVSQGSRYRGPAIISAFTITYQSNSAPVAARVANEFVTMVLEQNISSRSERATETYEFFRREVERLARALLDLETEIARYKNENGEALPESYQFRLNQMSSLEQRRFQREQRRAAVEEQRRMLERMVREGIAPQASPQTPEERELATLRRLLLQKRTVLADSHPEIAALRANISALETAITPPTQAAANATGASSAPRTSLAEAQARSQLEVVKRELAQIAEQHAADAERVAALEASLAKTPQIEMALSSYGRRYQNLQFQYDNAVRKLAEAEIGQRLEVNHQAERFEVIEQAQVPGEPVAPKRLLIAAGGAGGSLMLGLALALALELSNPAIRTGADLQRRLQLRPVVTVPYIHTPGERRRRVLRWIVRIGLVIGLIAATLWALENYIMPLEVLWTRILEQSGLSEAIRLVRARLA